MPARPVAAPRGDPLRVQPSEPILVIYAPTASGKSALALGIASALRAQGRAGEIITADAMQVYRGLDIGTAKPTAGERARVPHHLLDEVDPHAEAVFSVNDWLQRCERVLREVRARGARPIVVGGTSLYVQALLYGLFDGPAGDPALRARIAAMDPHARRAELERIDPEAAARIHASDERRTVRALEVFHLTGRTISSQQGQWNGQPPRAGARLIVLSWPVEEQNRRINARVKAMMEGGLLDEVRGLLARGPLNRQAREALGYKQLLAHLHDPRRLSLPDAVEQIKIETRRFAKNQRTWLKRLGATPGAVKIEAWTQREREAVAAGVEWLEHQG